MGLDMYMMGRKFFWRTDRQEDGFPLSKIDVEIAYWRKHANLHGYIVQTYANGEDNCQEIELGMKELEDIIDAVKTRRLPHTEGFFFGTSATGDDELAEEMKNDLAQLSKAVAWLTRPNGVKGDVYLSVVYRASW